MLGSPILLCYPQIQRTVFKGCFMLQKSCWNSGGRLALKLVSRLKVLSCWAETSGFIEFSALIIRQKLQAVAKTFTFTRFLLADSGTASPADTWSWDEVLWEIKQARLPQRQRKAKHSEKDKLKRLEEGILIMNVNVVVCCNQSPYSAGCSLSLHREPSCTHTSAQVDLSEYLQGF